MARARRSGATRRTNSFEPIFEILTIDARGRGADHKSIQEFIAVRREVFVDTHGKDSRYNTSKPIAQDSWPDTVFIIAKDPKDGRVIGGMRLLVCDAKNANELPIANPIRSNNDGKFDRVKIDTKSCKGVKFIELTGLVVAKEYQGRGVTKSINKQMVEYVPKAFDKYVLLAEAVDATKKMLKKVFQEGMNGAHEVGEIASLIKGESLAVLATTNIAEEDISLEGVLSLSNGKSSDKCPPSILSDSKGKVSGGGASKGGFSLAGLFKPKL